jgi:2-haloacid dehalogenase
VRPGLERLRTRCRLAPCSNGNISLMIDLARRNGFPWDAILGAELARDYKPKPAVYIAAVDALDLPPDQVMMVAAHPSDLAAAARAGLRTAFIERPNEFGPGRGDSLGSERVDYAVASLTALADALDT